MTAAPVATDQVLVAREVTKVYGGTQALRGVTLGIRRGRVTALFGENGAGKSTLMKILAGIETPSTGFVELDGEPVAFATAREAADRGIAIIHQELSLCANMSIEDNLFLAREVTKRGGVDRATQRAEARRVLERLEERLDPATLVQDLRLGQQQVVEIARSLLQEARILIMDEPTSALSAPEVEVLFKVIRELTAAGVSIVYISHHLEEALDIADDVAVLRDGNLVATAVAEEVDLGWIVRQMVGRDSDELFPRRTPELGDALLEVRDLRVADPSAPERLAIDDVTFGVRAGEIVGVYGLMGCGRTELLEAIAGRIPVESGELLLGGEPLAGDDLRGRIRRGLALVPEDRQRDGLVPTMSVGENLSLSALTSFVKGLFVNRDREKAAVADMVRDVTVKTSGPGAPIGSLSGGNQQKVVIGKALMTGPRVLLLDEPSRGVDVGAKADVFELMAQQAREGLAVLFTTSEADEALHIPDRLLVLVRGRIVADVHPADLDRERLMALSDSAQPDHSTDDEGAGR